MPRVPVTVSVPSSGVSHVMVVVIFTEDRPGAIFSNITIYLLSFDNLSFLAWHAAGCQAASGIILQDADGPTSFHTELGLRVDDGPRW